MIARDSLGCATRWRLFKIPLCIWLNCHCFKVKVFYLYNSNAFYFFTQQTANRRTSDCFAFTVPILSSFLYHSDNPSLNFLSSSSNSSSVFSDSWLMLVCLISFCSTSPKSLAIMFGFRRSAAAPVNF